MLIPLFDANIGTGTRLRSNNRRPGPGQLLVLALESALHEPALCPLPIPEERCLVEDELQYCDPGNGRRNCAELIYYDCAMSLFTVELD
jgi:hypothetical protein